MDHRATIDHYERVADEYAQRISPEPPARRADPFLLSIREGDGGTPPPAPMWFWRRADLAAALDDAGLAVRWEDHHVDEADEAWLTVLATAR